MTAALQPAPYRRPVRPPNAAGAVNPAAIPPARSTGYSSTSAKTITTTSSTPTNGYASPWPGSKRCPAGSSRIPSSGTHDAPEAEVAGRGVGGLGLASCWPIAKTVVRRAQVRTALDHLRRRRAGLVAAQTAHSSAGVAAHSRWPDRVPLGLPRRCRQRACDCSCSPSDVHSHTLPVMSMRP